jgi:hypothetical protein
MSVSGQFGQVEAAKLPVIFVIKPFWSSEIVAARLKALHFLPPLFQEPAIVFP